jgi:hypothetical protein
MNLNTEAEIHLDGPYLDILLLNKEGYCCSQIMVKLVLKSLGRDNADLVRAMAALCHGIGYSGGTCGVLTGGACALSLSLGTQEFADQALPSRLSELVDWFTTMATDCYGGIRCDQILAASPGKRACSALMVATLEKVLSLSQCDAVTDKGRDHGNP